MNKMLSSNLEDYLEIICNFQREGRIIRAVDISNAFGISRASVTEALQKLALKGLITYDKMIKLTDEGMLCAGRVVSKHTVLQEFFEKVLDLPSEDASENACKIEHVISDNAFDKIEIFTKNFKK